MVSFGILIMVGAIALCIGGLVGALISRSLFPPEQQKKLEESLSSTRNDLQKYQSDVANHFAETAKLVNTLTDSYKDVHEHLARGATKLSNAEISREMLRAGDEKLGISPGDILQEGVQPPKDWAPKIPGQTGTLSEEYGLDELKESDADSELLATTKNPAN
ncbi:MAG: uncharacterized membrane-anchored protein YhcB (DUF1043 family) [Flavobacteriales bacterium]